MKTNKEGPVGGLAHITRLEIFAVPENPGIYGDAMSRIAPCETTTRLQSGDPGSMQVDHQANIHVS